MTLTVAAVMFMLLLDSTILNTSLPSIAHALGPNIGIVEHAATAGP